MTQTNKSAAKAVRVARPNLNDPKLVAREGDVFILVIAYYWGKGKTVKEAIAKVKENSAKTVREIEKGGWVLYSVDPETRIDGMGGFCYPQAGNQPLLIAEAPKA